MKVTRTVAAAVLTAAATLGPAASGAATTSDDAGAQAAGTEAALSWPEHCLDAVPDGPEDYQEAFDHRYSGWAGADGALPIPLPDGRVMWLFGDTLMGEVNENDELLPGWHFLRSVQIQDGACFTPMTRGTVDAPTSFFPDLDGVAFWPSGGYVDDSVEPAVLRVVSSGVCVDDAGWWVCTMAIHTLSLTDFEVLSVDTVPYDTEARNMPAFGATFFHDGDHVYLYGSAAGFQRNGWTEQGPFDRGLYLARVPDDRLLDDEAWRYATDDGRWSPSAHQADPMAFVEDPEYPENIAPGGVVRWGDGYLMTGKRGWLWVFGTQVYAWEAPTPSGPWTLVRQDGEPADIVPDHVAWPQTRWNYGGSLVMNVPGTSPDDPMLVFSTNALGCDLEDNDPPCTPDTELTMNVMLYGPHFNTPVRLPDPAG